MRNMESLTIAPGWTIPAEDLSVRFVRSSGPGGQNVNKVATKVEMRFALARCSQLSDGQRARLAAIVPGSVTQAGEMVLFSDETRSQLSNLERVRARLRGLLLQARQAPKKRRPTRPSRAAKARRADEKKRRSSVKANRQRIRY